MVTKSRKNIKKPRQRKGYSNKDIYLKLESVEKRIYFSHRTQIRIGLSAVGIAFVILGLSLWSDFLQLIGIDSSQGSILPIGYIIMGAITMICAYIVTRPRQEVKRRQATELTEQEIRKLEKSIATNHGSFSLGLFATALLVYSTSEGSGWVTFVVIGGIFVLSSLHFLCANKFIPNKKRRSIINTASFARINHIEWFLGFVPFGVGLIQTIRLDWAAVVGIICIIVGYAVLAYGLGKSIRTIKEEVQKMGSKGRKSIKKPKQPKKK